MEGVVSLETVNLDLLLKCEEIRRQFVPVSWIPTVSIRNGSVE